MPLSQCEFYFICSKEEEGGGDITLHSYLAGQPVEDSQLSMLACFLVYYSVPAPKMLLEGKLEGSSSFSELLLKFQDLRMPVRALLRLAPLLLGNPQSMVL
ncbi:hypothetical protein AB205_0200740 [Aquarana catesbeiana]|uniref:Uncharacterized protein n=1 Tax=Aquarana catesbeiana TaxID=8400 RepID=A0A2G9S5C2_AQUCT|nr:hypothetical protein AB205_0200740 [Aquarana catesbeiana]